MTYKVQTEQGENIAYFDTGIAIQQGTALGIHGKTYYVKTVAVSFFGEGEFQRILNITLVVTEP